MKSLFRLSLLALALVAVAALTACGSSSSNNKKAPAASGGTPLTFEVEAAASTNDAAKGKSAKLNHWWIGTTNCAATNLVEEGWSFSQPSVVVGEENDGSEEITIYSKEVDWDGITSYVLCVDVDVSGLLKGIDGTPKSAGFTDPADSITVVITANNT